mmetsp:Transcript_54286/g.174049  ORF Transcript_54286/g.174049 Transcript_54286/m.174049 type:complete len:210 (+) Transcript_54286:779-1408(+)
MVADVELRELHGAGLGPGHHLPGLQRAVEVGEADVPAGLQGGLDLDGPVVLYLQRTLRRLHPKLQLDRGAGREVKLQGVCRGDVRAQLDLLGTIVVDHTHRVLAALKEEDAQAFELPPVANQVKLLEYELVVPDPSDELILVVRVGRGDVGVRPEVVLVDVPEGKGLALEGALLRLLGYEGHVHLKVGALQGLLFPNEAAAGGYARAQD